MFTRKRRISTRRRRNARRYGLVAFLGLFAATGFLPSAVGADDVVIQADPEYTVQPPPFSDIANDPFQTEIEFIAANGITTGFPDGTYRPFLPVARDAMAAFMNRFAGEQCSIEGALGYQAPGTASFTDVPADNQFHKEISWMKDSGVSTGYPDASFHPYENVSREAMAAFIHRLDTYTNENGGCNSF